MGSGETEAYTDVISSSLSSENIAGDDFTIICYVGTSDVVDSTYILTSDGEDGLGYPMYITGAIPEYPSQYGRIFYNHDLDRFEFWAYSFSGTIPEYMLFYYETQEATVSCDPQNWIIPNQFCTLEFICPETSSTEEYTLVRTFTADDGCGN